jgi:hypothetical protein
MTNCAAAISRTMDGAVSNRCGSWSGIVQDVDDRDLLPADLLRHVAVEILRSDDRNLTARRTRVREDRQCA